MITDFRKAFMEGINSAEYTAKKNAEIKKVIEEMNRQIQQATHRKISLSIESHQSDLSTLASMFSFKGGEPEVTPSYIVATNNLTGEKEELARWEIAPTAYPCTIAYSNLTEYCNDRESLELKLSELLSHPSTGSKMFNLMHSARPDPRKGPKM